MSQEVTIKKSTYNQILAGVFVLAVALSFTSGYIIGGSGSTAAAPAVVQQPSAPQGQPEAVPEEPGRVQVSVDDDAAIGQTNAPLTVIEFSDFQCPFCGRAFTDAVAGIKQDYIAAGKARFVYRDFPLSFHPEALPAALAAECAKEQGKFWEYHDKIFQNQQSLGDTSFKTWAKELGLNEAQFSSCYDTKKYESEVGKDYQDGITAGVSGTPTFFIGTPSKGYVKIVGAQPYAAIKQVIEQELAG